MVDADILLSWLPAWREAYTAIPVAQVPARLHPHRLPYYQRALETMLSSEHYAASLWPLWHTWTTAICELPEDSAHRTAWEAAGTRLGQVGTGFAERIHALDAVLDLVEDTLDEWAKQSGA